MMLKVPVFTGVNGCALVPVAGSPKQQLPPQAVLFHSRTAWAAQSCPHSLAAPGFEGPGPEPHVHACTQSGPSSLGSTFLASPPRLSISRVLSYLLML